MKILILLSTFFSLVLSLAHAQTTSQIEGYLEVYHPEDTTSIYIGREAGKLTNPSVIRNNTILGNFAGAVLTTGGGNSFFGKNAGKSTNTGFQNSFFGEDAGLNNTTAFQNSFFGMKAGFANTSGSANSFFGMETGLSNTTGFQNSFFGQRAGKFNTSGWNNSFAGHAAGFRNTTGSDNSFFGMTAGRENTAGICNSYFGKDAGYQDTTGSYNSYFGYQAGLRIMGSGNVCIGARAGPLSDQSVGSNRLFIDNDSTNNPLIYGEFDNDLARINGYLEVCHPEDSTSMYIGKEAGRFTNPTIMRNNTIVGNSAGADLTTGGGNSFFGKNAGKATTTGFQNSFFGENAGFKNTTASMNSFFGMDAGFENTTGASNSFFGHMAGRSNTTGFTNSFFGVESGIANTIGARNCFFGMRSGTSNTEGYGNNFFGIFSGASNSTGAENSFYGDSAGGSNTMGSQNCFFGNSTGFANTTGFHNSYFGYNVGSSQVNAIGNSFFGWNAGTNLLGSNNICIGYHAGPSAPLANNQSLYIDVLQTDSPLIYGEFNNDLLQINGTLTMGNTNYFGGNDDGVIRSSTAVSSDLFMVSNDAFVIELDDDNTEDGNFEIWDGEDDAVLRMLDGGQFEIYDGEATNNRTLLLEPDGDLFIDGRMTVGILGAAGSTDVCRNGSGELATCSSSLRYKSNVKPFSAGLDILSRLQPVTFQWKQNGQLDLGLIAEEVAEAEPLLTTSNERGQVEGVKYDRIGVLLINAMKEQQAMIKALQEENANLKKENTFFQQEMTAVLDAHQEAIEALRQEVEQAFSN